MSEHNRLSPDEALKYCNLEAKGQLKIFIGYAPGVGKTFAMLNEGNRRRKYGRDVVIGYVEAHGRAETDQEIRNLEIVPYKKIIYNNIEMFEPDVDAIIKRKPIAVLIDELAHTNCPGSKNKKRYEDVEEILCSGINVITTLNIQHLESLNDVVFSITGIKVNETIPDYIVQNADEIVVVDLTPDALQNRLKRGNIYDTSKIPQALKNFFRKGNLNALRELTLRQTAEEVDEDLNEYMKKEGITDNWCTVERLMVCISPNPNSKKLIRRCARMATRLKCEWHGVSVDCTHRFAKKLSEAEKRAIEMHFKLAQQLGGETVLLEGKSVSDELVKWANSKHITQIFIGYPNRTFFEKLVRGSTVDKLIKLAQDIDIHLISNRK